MPDSIEACLPLEIEMSARENRLPESGVTWLTLFTTLGTLICCALPIMLVTLGLGAAVASLTSSFPLLITLSRHKGWVFALSAILLLISGWLLYRSGRSCPTDPQLGALCDRTQRWNRRVFWISVAIWGSGFTAAYLALPIRLWLENH
jgi:Na+/melibiose symporter-like transporter